MAVARGLRLEKYNDPKICNFLSDNNLICYNGCIVNAGELDVRMNPDE
jgi:hypothetical protein